MEVEVDVLDSPSLIDLVASLDEKQLERSELRSCVEVDVDVLDSPSLIDLVASLDEKQLERSELRSCVKVEVDVRGSPSLIVLNMVSVDVKQHLKKKKKTAKIRSCVKV